MLTTLIKTARDIILPTYCLGCMRLLKDHRDNLLICSNCKNKIELYPQGFCLSCGINMTNINLETCPKCAQLKNIHKRFHFERALSAYKYENPLKNIIHLFKYSGYSGLGKYLGTMLFNFIENYHIPTHIFDLLIPMPLSSRKLREREFNQSLVLANELSRLINIPVLNDTLVRNKDTKSQASLTTSERLKNVENAFSLSHPEKVAKKSILLIDDVITTASTANAASLSLKEAGCGQLFVLTLARSYI